MTLEEVKESYQSLIDKEKRKLSKLKKAIFQIGTIRLVIVLVCLIFCYLTWNNTPTVVAIIGVSLILFLFFMKYHNKLFIKKKYCELLVQNAENELKGIDYDFSAFDGAPEKADGNHSYSLDLDMFGNHSLFQSINRTVTSFGKDRLANSLLAPYENKADILVQQEAIKELASNPRLLNHFRATGQMTETKDLDIHYFSQQFLQTKLLSKSIWRHLIYIVPAIYAILIILSILGIISSSGIGIFWTICFAISLAPLKDINKKMNLFEKKIEVLQIYSQLLQIIETESFNSPLLKKLQAKIKNTESASLAIHHLKSYSNNLDQSSNILGLLILNPFLLWNIMYSIKIEKWILTHKENVSDWFKVLAKFDSLVSFSIYAYNHPDYIYPEVSDTYMLEGKDLGHPMLNRKACVRNDVTISTQPFFLVVTGANMAGKSTYLRTIGINLTLASTGAPICATSFKFYPYRLVTDLRTSDSLTDNESYFFAELKRLKMIIDRLQSGEPLFIILDEILKGTNSEDKQKGSIALMKQLVSLDGNGIIATHDLVLGNLEKEFPNAIKNYRFEADIKDEHLSFTYKIREGMAQNMNASFLMKKMGITGL
ncbi:MAG: MutS-related protein [Dysgonomonas sp.]